MNTFISYFYFNYANMNKKKKNPKFISIFLFCEKSQKKNTFTFINIQINSVSSNETIFQLNFLISAINTISREKNHSHLRHRNFH